MPKIEKREEKTVAHLSVRPSFSSTGFVNKVISRHKIISDLFSYPKLLYNDGREAQTLKMCNLFLHHFLLDSSLQIQT